MNVYIEGLGYTNDSSTRVRMRVIKSASLSMSSKLVKFKTTPMEAAEFLEQFFVESIKAQGAHALNSINRVFRSLKEYEQKHMPKLSDEWPSQEMVQGLFDAYMKRGKLGLLKAIEENQEAIK